MANADSSLKVGDIFSSFEELKGRLNAFQIESITQFIIRLAEKLKSDDQLFDLFKHSKIRYGCKQGQRKHQPEGSFQQRPKQRSFKVGCPVDLNIRLNRPKGGTPFLKINKLDVEHQNHQVSKEIFKLYPEQRRFELDETDKVVLSSITMGVSEQRDIIERRHNRTVLTQDIYNVQRKNMLLRAGGGDDEIKCDKILKDVVDAGGFEEVGKDERDCFLFAVFQTKSMKNVLSSFSECLIMDATYKVNNYLYPLLTVMAIDGEGHGLHVFHAILSKEDRHIMERCLRIFALQYNSALTSCFIVDKDMAELAALGAVFPGVPVNLCHFHISRAVERYLRKELGRGSTFLSLVLRNFMQQVCTESEDEFNDLRSEISSIVPQTVIQYFQDDWWDKRHLWAACCNRNVLKLRATTTNTLESYHSKIKKTINEKLNLSNTFLALVAFNDSKIIENQWKFILSSTSEVYDYQNTDPVSCSITKTMTRFGADLVKRELVLSREVTYSVSSDNGADYLLSYKDRPHHTSICTCSYSTHGHLKIPCRHIFFLRCFLQLPIFSESLVPQRFKQSGLNLCTSAPSSDFIVRTVSSSTSSSSTIKGRYRQAKTVCDSIVN